MRQPVRLVASERHRLAAVEQSVERLEKIEPMVLEMHEILIAVRTIGRFLRVVLTWIGGPSAVGTAGLYAWRFFSGH